MLLLLFSAAYVVMNPKISVRGSALYQSTSTDQVRNVVSVHETPQAKIETRE